MLHSRSDHWIGLQAKAIAWGKFDAQGVLCWHTRPWNGSLESLKTTLTTEAPSRQPQLLLGPSLARHWLQAPSMGVSSLNELHAIAHARAVQLLGTQAPLSPLVSNSANGWHVDGDWQATRAFVCAAWPAQLSALSIPQCTPLLNAMCIYRTLLPRDGWLALTVANELHLMLIHRGHVNGVRSTRLQAQLTTKDMQDVVMQEWQRDRLRQPNTTTGEQGLHWLHLMPNAIESVHHKSLSLIKLQKPLMKRSVSFEAPSLDEQEAYLTAWSGFCMGGCFS